MNAMMAFPSCCSSLLILVFLFAILSQSTALLSQRLRECSLFGKHAFIVPAPKVSHFEGTEARSTNLHAKKGKKKSVRTPKSSSGFGGAATEPCPCGSGLGYMKCCGKLHKDPDVFAAATAEQVVRARYSAYAKREIDFIMGSTHPLNNNFISDIQHWKETIEKDCYDNFELTQCNILSESYDGEGDGETATVKFVANMIQVDSREKTAFMETSTFERGSSGAWLYRDGLIETPPGQEYKSGEIASEESTTDKRNASSRA